MALHPLLRTRQLAACCLFGVCAGTAALAATPLPGASVAVHAAHVVVGGRVYGDLDAAVQAVKATGAQAVRIDTCMPGAARMLRAVVYRLREHALYPRVLRADVPACAAAAAMVPASMRAGGPVGGDEAAVDRYWDGLMP